jgi:hypothetical protein
MKKRAFVRYSKQGKIVPGSLILTSGSFPSGPSTWNEVPADLCCAQSFDCNSCITLQGVPGEGFLYGFTLRTKNSGPNLTGTIYWATGQQESFSLPSNGDSYNFEYEYEDYLIHTVRLCVNNPSQLLNFELGNGPGNTIALTNASVLNGIDEWDSDGMNIYALDLTGLSSIDELYHCCGILTFINITGCTNLLDVELDGNALLESSVDHVLVTLDNNGLSNGYVDLSGGFNAVPSATGLAAKTSLEGKGWTVIVNP